MEDLDTERSSWPLNPSTIVLIGKRERGRVFGLGFTFVYCVYTYGHAWWHVCAGVHV